MLANSSTLWGKLTFSSEVIQQKVQLLQLERFFLNKGYGDSAQQFYIEPSGSECSHMPALAVYKPAKDRCGVTGYAH